MASRLAAPLLICFALLLSYSWLEDRWISHQCPPNPDGCILAFEDPEFVSNARETVYYVRAIEEPSPAVNAALMRCEYNEEGECIQANIFSASPRITPLEEDCLASTEERAWSSPIFRDFSP